MVNGDVYDIGETVNGISRFLWFNDEWYYFEQRLSSKYEYDQDDLTKLIVENEFDEVKLLGNIFCQNYQRGTPSSMTSWLDYHFILNETLPNM